MDNIIEKLIQIEENAVFISKDAEEKRKNFPVQLENVKNEINQRMKNATNEELEKLNRAMYIDTKEKIDEINMKMQARISELEKEYSENSDKWVNEIFYKIIES